MKLFSRTKYYFVSYCFFAEASNGIGSCTRTIQNGHFDFLEAQKSIAEQFGFKQVVLTNWKQIKEPVSQERWIADENSNTKPNHPIQKIL